MKQNCLTPTNQEIPWYRSSSASHINKVMGHVNQKTKTDNLEKFILMHDIIKFGD